MPSPELIEALRDAQRFGFFGPGRIEAAIDHATAFVTAIEDTTPTRLVDLGSGGGLPGLVLAEAFPAAEVVLVDRRQKRTDFLRRAVSRLGWQHVVVVAGDAADLVATVSAGGVERFDVVTARGFGPPELTVSIARELITPAGRIVISEPPPAAGDRWDADLLTRLGLISERVGAVRVFRFGAGGG